MKGNQEIEAVFYAQIGDVTGLSKADEVEEHDQIESRLLNGDKIRVRKTTNGNEVSYTFTAKQKSAESVEGKLVSSSVEYDVPCDEAFFNAFLEIAEQRMIKTRYRYKNRKISLEINESITPITVDNVGYEVDVFKTGGSPCEWVKIDVELDSLLEYVEKNYPDIGPFKLVIKTSHLECKPINMIFPPIADEQQKQMIQELWKTQFTNQLRSAKTND